MFDEMTGLASVKALDLDPEFLVTKDEDFLHDRKLCILGCLHITRNVLGEKYLLHILG